MLQRDKRISEAEPQRPSHTPSATSASLISSDMQVVGDLKSAGNIRIEGRVNGEIHAQAVDVSPGALIDGSINALAIQIGGSVKGRGEAKQVKIQNSGEMLGDVLYEALEIESGATLEGYCKHRGSKPSLQREIGAGPKSA